MLVHYGMVMICLPAQRRDFERFPSLVAVGVGSGNRQEGVNMHAL
jgi:hypothetical protein